jgi:mono/diheme cytochrome c family protein
MDENMQRYSRLARLAALSLLGLAASACVDREERHVAGSDLFRQYCAACHGSDGKGNGPLAGSLKKPPADLTRIAERNGGKLDEAALMSVIDGRSAVAEHGPRDMPVWGARFEEDLRKEGEPMHTYVGLLQSRSLVDYLRTIQAKP